MTVRPQLTLAAWYGVGKPDALLEVTAALQGIAARHLGGRFTPYVTEQVHATVLSLESDDTGDGVWMGRGHRLDAVGAAAMVLQELTERPATILVGGYSEGGDVEFTSQGRPPFERGFLVQGGIVVAMGWPTPQRRGAIAALRRRGDGFGARHKYHRSLDDADDDVFFRIGLVERVDGDATAVDACVTEGRRWLAGHRRELVLDARCVAVVAYSDETLAPDSTQAWPLADWLSSSR